MISFENVTFGFPEKDLYNNISFNIEMGEHVALIGSNGCGKSSLVQLLMNEEKYTYEGTINLPQDMRIGYVSQFVEHEDNDVTVFDFLAKPFVDMMKHSDKLCTKMENAEDLDNLYAEYQECLDEIEAIDGYNYSHNIEKRLATAGLKHIGTISINKISGGEYKLLHIIRSMLVKPQLLVMDEPDVFLDFDNLIGLTRLINEYEGTILAITHSRLLLSQCFNKILHIENLRLNMFPGTYAEYSQSLLETKIDLFERKKETDDLIIAQKIVIERLRDSAEFTSDPKKGRQLRARKHFLERIYDNKGEDAFLEEANYNFKLNAPEEMQDGTVISVKDYSLVYDHVLLNNVSFDINAGEKVVIVGNNGTGKSSILRDIYSTLQESSVTVGYFRQIVESDESLHLSGGERNVAQIENLCREEHQVLILDEPTSHLDVNAQIALEKAIREYTGTILMVSHDFFTVTSCADRILIIEDGTIREMSGRSYRKSVYKNYFQSDVFEIERKRIETEIKVQGLIKKGRFDEARIALGIE